MFKRKKPITDDRALVAFKELMAVTGRSAELMGRATAELVKVGPHVADPGAIEALTQAQQLLHDATSDQRACVGRVAQILGVH